MCPACYRRKQALNSVSCCFPFFFSRRTPQVYWRFWPDLWPLSSTSQTLGNVEFLFILRKFNQYTSLWNRQTQYRLQLFSQKSGDTSIILDMWSGASLGRQKKNTCKHSEPLSKAAFWPLPPSPREKQPSTSDHVNGPLQYLMFLYGVLTIECRNGMHVWLLGWVHIHLPNRAMHSDVEREGVMKAWMDSAAKPAMFYPCWTQALKHGWSICLGPCRHFAEATQATVVCGES